MFRLIEPPSGQIQNILPIYSISEYITGSHTVYKIRLTLKIVFYSISRFMKLLVSQERLCSLQFVTELRMAETVKHHRVHSRLSGLRIIRELS
jgi:hypothetical protein